MKLIKVARTALEVLFGGFSGVRNACECAKFYGWAEVGRGQTSELICDSATLKTKKSPSSQ